MTRRILALALTALLATAACTSPGTEPSGDETVGPAGGPAPAAPRPAGPQRLPIGGAATFADGALTATITLSDAKVIPPPEGWGPERVLVATAAWDVTAGSARYEETGFVLVSPDGTRDRASTVASDSGLPGRALGSGDLTGPGKARGLVTFDAPATLVGHQIELVDAGGTIAVWTLA